MQGQHQPSWDVRKSETVCQSRCLPLLIIGPHWTSHWIYLTCWITYDKLHTKSYFIQKALDSLARQGETAFVYFEFSVSCLPRFSSRATLSTPSSISPPAPPANLLLPHLLYLLLPLSPPTLLSVALPHNLGAINVQNHFLQQCAKVSFPLAPPSFFIVIYTAGDFCNVKIDRLHLFVYRMLTLLVAGL